MRAGTLNRLISIRLPASTSRSTSGQPIVTYTTVLDRIWADRVPVSGREMFKQDERWSEVTTRWLIRYSTKIDTTCKLIDIADSSAEYDIQAVINIGDKDEGLEILAKKVE
jgi:SPP1 family predicted phage head-tail adaptor